MVTLTEEMERVADYLHEEASALKVSECPSLGAMIETPAAALTVKEFIKHSDFFSIGTNDLTQYTMAAGRNNPFVSDYFVSNHLAVLRLIRNVVEDAGQIPVSLCGELTNLEEHLPDLLQAGIRSFTVSPQRIPFLKQAIRELSHR